jgi:hypothetical protein
MLMIIYCNNLHLSKVEGCLHKLNMNFKFQPYFWFFTKLSYVVYRLKLNQKKKTWPPH